MKQATVKSCENFIRATFRRLRGYDGTPKGIEVGCFWKLAQDAGLWEPGIYGGPMSQALDNLAVVETVHDDDGKFLYNVFRLAQ